MITIRQFIEEDRNIIEMHTEKFQEYLMSMDTKQRLQKGKEYGEKRVAQMLDEIRKRNGMMYVAGDGEQGGGFSACVGELQDAIAQLDNIPSLPGVILELYVEDVYRGKGGGKMLMQQMESFLKEKGCDQVWVEVFGPNVQAKAFYEMCGYEVRDFVMGKEI